MALLDRDLGAIFGAAFAPIYLDATLQKSALADDGSGGFGVEATPYPIKAMLAGLSERARAASGLPETALTISVLRAGVAVAPDLGDRIVVSGRTFRLIRVDTDPAAAATLAVAVPA